MAKVDGLIILDTNGKPLITSNFPQHPPSYPSTHIDAYNHALKLKASSSSRDEPLDPVIWVDTLSWAAITGGHGATGAGLCHVQKEGLKFLVPVADEVNPLFAFAFLDSFLGTLREYLGDVTETLIKENFDIVYMLIEEMLDEGHPMTTETSMLKEIVLPPTLMGKLLNVAGVSGLQSAASAPFAAPIPWRRQNVRHSTNEITFDIEESLDAVLDRKGNVITSSVTGTIDCSSRLTGIPDLTLVVGNAKALNNCGFHPCIRYSKWERDSVLSFIPPDGRFRLLGYRAETPANLKPPLHLKPSFKIEENGGKFSLTLASRLTHRPLENIVISIHLGAGASSVSATATGDRRTIGPTGASGAGKKNDVPEGGVGGGTWEFDPHTQVLKWKLSSLVSNERPPSLTGSFTSTELHPGPSPSFQIEYTVQNHSYSGIRVDQLKVAGDVLYKPYKGVRSIAKAGKLDVRW